jgi:hypothetical protein
LNFSVLRKVKRPVSFKVSDLGPVTFPVKSNGLKGAQAGEFFDGVFAQSEPIWICDVGT